jgi:hypothetical protein
MRCFTQELSCTDGSTDAYIFRPSVHPTLYKSVGPTRHNGLAPFLAPNPTPLRAAAVLRAPSSSLPPVKSHAPMPPQPSCPPPAPRARRWPSRRSAASSLSRVRRLPLRPRVSPRRGFRPSAAAGSSPAFIWSCAWTNLPSQPLFVVLLRAAVRILPPLHSP